VAALYFLIAAGVPRLCRQHTRKAPVEVVPTVDQEYAYVRSPLLDHRYRPSAQQIVPAPALFAICSLGPLAVQAALSKLVDAPRVRKAAVAARLYSFVYAIATTLCVVDLVKRYCGYWRPYFYDECDYDTNTGTCDKSPDDAFRSFPSGHAAASAAALGHATLCLLGALGPGRPDRVRLRRGGGRRANTCGGGALASVDLGNLKLVAALAPSMVALWIAATRVVDNDHHPADVVAGTALGFGFAALFYSRYFPSPFAASADGASGGSSSLDARRPRPGFLVEDDGPVASRGDPTLDEDDDVGGAGACDYNLYGSSSHSQRTAAAVAVPGAGDDDNHGVDLEQPHGLHAQHV